MKLIIDTTKIKSLVIASVIGTSSFFVQGCTEQDAKDILTVIAVAAIIGSDTQPVVENPPRYNECYDHHSNQYCESILPPDRRRHFSENSTDKSLSLFSSQSVQFLKSEPIVKAELSRNDKVNIMAEKYALTVESADKLQSALEKAQNNDFSGVDDIGISRQDIKAIYDNKSISRYSTVNISAAFHISFDDAKVFVKKLKADIQKAKLEVHQ